MTGNRILARDTRLVPRLCDCRLQRVYHLVARDNPIVQIEQDGVDLIRQGHRGRIGETSGSAVKDSSIDVVEPSPKRAKRDFVARQATHFDPDLLNQLICAHD